ncbi:uncharacterized protein NH340_JMT09227 [Sarcoptes scabiei]|nr:uncharacterized protein NH340_JMT09227 [Sarcoptes scabiei]
MHNNLVSKIRLNNLNAQPAIIKAIVANRIEEVRNIVKTEPYDYFTIDDNELKTPLHLAAALGRTEILRLLIDTKCFNLNCRDVSSVTPIHRACRNDHDQCLQLLIDSKADVNARTRHHLTPLHICAIFGSIKCARILIKFISNIDTTDSFGATALHYAVYCSRLQDRMPIIELLLDHNARADVRDKLGQRAIHYATYSDNPSVIRILVERAGVDVNVRNRFLVAPVHLAVANKNFNAFYELLSLNANINAQDINGNDVSHWAAYVGFLPIFEMVSERMEMTQPNLYGVTPLHYACYNKKASSITIVFELLKLYTNNCDITDKIGRTPLHYAAISDSDKIASLLLENGSDKNHCDSDFESPLHEAVQNISRNVINVLLDSKVNINLSNQYGFTPLHIAVMTNNGQLCRFLIEARADPLLTDKNGRTPHFMAAYVGSIECFYEIMSSPIYINLIVNAEKHGQTAILFPPLDGYKRNLLHYASASKCPADFLQILLLHNMKQFNRLHPKVLSALTKSLQALDVNQQDLNGRTPLHYLCRRTNEINDDITSLIRLFVSRANADYSLIDGLNCYPLHYAVLNGYSSAIRFLINQDWFLNHSPYDEKFHRSNCPLKIAAYFDHSQTLDELISLGFNDFEPAFEIAIQRRKWNCAQKLYNFIRKKSILINTARYVAFNGLSEGFKMFMNLPAVVLDQLFLVASSSKEGSACIELLVLNSVNIFARDRQGRNALFYACLSGTQSTIKFLLQFGVKFIRDHQGRNVFHYLAYRGDFQRLSLILDVCKSLRLYSKVCQLLLSKDCEGLSPINVACYNRHQKFLEFYIENINCEYADKLMFISGIVSNFSFLDYIVKKMGKTFLKTKGNSNRSKDLSVLKFLMQIDFDVNSMDEKGYTPLLCAAYVGNAEYVQFFLNETSADPLKTDLEGNTIMHLACLAGSSKTAMVIWNYAKKQNLQEEWLTSKNGLDQTVLHLAAKQSLPTVIQELLRAGASVNDEDWRGYSPSLYCTKDVLAAYCLVIIESYMETGISSWNRTISSGTVKSTINHNENNIESAEEQQNLPQINGRFSLPTTLERCELNHLVDEHLVKRLRQMSNFFNETSKSSLVNRDSLKRNSMPNSVDINSYSNEKVSNPESIDSDFELY